jgi:surface carbohydrate biosynthesis protein
LDEEGAVDYPDWRTLRRRYSETLVKYADVVFFWGEKQKEYFQKKLGSSKSKLVLSGHPRFFIDAEENAHENHVSESFILINTNMSFGNNLLGEDHIRQNYSGRISNLDELIRFDNQKISLIMEFIREFRSRSDLPIYLRPHPEECETVYRLPIQNYVVSKAGVVNDLITNAYKVIHTDCTTAVEAYLLGFRPVSLLPNGFENFKTVLPRNVSVCFSDFQEAVDNVLKDDDKTKTSNYVDLSEWLYNEENPVDVIIREIIDLRKRLPYRTIYIFKSIEFLIVFLFIALVNLKALMFRTSLKSVSIGRSKLEQFDSIYRKSTENKKYKRIHKFVNIIVFR